MFETLEYVITTGPSAGRPPSRLRCAIRRLSLLVPLIGNSIGTTGLAAIGGRLQFARSDERTRNDTGSTTSHLQSWPVASYPETKRPPLTDSIPPKLTPAGSSTDETAAATATAANASTTTIDGKATRTLRSVLHAARHRKRPGVVKREVRERRNWWELRIGPAVWSFTCVARFRWR